MTQRELNRALARATGESLHDIAEHGFVLLSPVPFERERDDDELERHLDWDEFDHERNVALVEQRAGLALA